MADVAPVHVILRRLGGIGIDGESIVTLPVRGGGSRKRLAPLNGVRAGNRTEGRFRGGPPGGRTCLHYRTERLILSAGTAARRNVSLLLSDSITYGGTDGCG